MFKLLGELFKGPATSGTTINHLDPVEMELEANAMHTGGLSNVTHVDDPHVTDPFDFGCEDGLF